MRTYPKFEIREEGQKMFEQLRNTHYNYFILRYIQSHWFHLQVLQRFLASSSTQTISGTSNGLIPHHRNIKDISKRVYNRFDEFLAWPDQSFHKKVNIMCVN